MRLATKGTETENLFETLAQKSAVGLYIVQDGKFCYTNPAFQSTTGYTEDELLGRHSLEIVIPEDREMVRENATKMLKGKLTSPYQFRVICKDDSIVWVMETIRSIQYHGKRATLADFINITEYKQSEEALRQSEEKHRALFDSSVIGMFVMDAETMKVVMANQAAARMMGLSSVEEAIGINPIDFVLPEDKDKAIEITIKEMFEQDLRRTHEYRVVNKDGREGWVSVTGARIMHEGRLSGLVSITDITEGKQAVEALRHSEERYRTMLAEMEDAYFEVDLGGHFTFVNNSVCRDLGYSREELMGMSYRNYAAEDDIESVFRIFNEVYRTGMPNKGFPWKTTRKDGTHGLAETSVSPMRNDKGEIIGFRGVGRDFTERNEAEKALQQSEGNYKALFNSSVTGAFVIDAETMKVVIANQSALEVFGFSSLEEVIGIDPLDFVHPDDRERVFKIITKDMFEQDLRQTNELRATTKEGKEIWISATGSRITHAGRLAGLISFTNITERKQAEEALRQSEANYRALFDSAVIGTIVLDAETMKVVIANQSAVKIFGFTSIEEALEVDPFDFIRPEDRERISELAEKALLEQDSQLIYELGAVTKDGREIWISATGTRIIHKGKLAGLISFTDITDKRLQDERLMMTDRLASLGELAAGAAHELNNPLTSIIGFSQLLMEKEVPDDIHEDLKLINNEAQRAVSVTNNLLTFARKHAPMKQPNQINNIIEDVLELRAHEQKVNHIDVERNLATNLPEIMVDYFQMQQVFMNIIINAEHFMAQAHNRGTLTIATRKQNSTVRISIADDGPGITPENLKHIFDPFFTTKEAGKGTGLGLSICHGIVTEHGGQIYVESQLGKGVTTFIELPIKRLTHIKSIL